MASKSEIEIINGVVVKLGAMFDAETALIQKARKTAIPAHLERRDELQSMIRALRPLVDDNGR